jgi:hypothetical protein
VLHYGGHETSAPAVRLGAIRKPPGSPRAYPAVDCPSRRGCDTAFRGKARSSRPTWSCRPVHQRQFPVRMCSLNILRLCALVATTQEQDERLALLPVVHPVAGSVVDPQLTEAAAHALPVAAQTFCKSIQSGNDAGTEQRTLLKDWHLELSAGHRRLCASAIALCASGHRRARRTDPRAPYAGPTSLTTEPVVWNRKPSAPIRAAAAFGRVRISCAGHFSRACVECGVREELQRFLHRWSRPHGVLGWADRCSGFADKRSDRRV